MWYEDYWLQLEHLQRMACMHISLGSLRTVSSVVFEIIIGLSPVAMLACYWLRITSKLVV